MVALIAGTGSRAVSPRLPPKIRAMLLARDGGLLAIWALLIALFAVWGQPFFLTTGNALQILGAAAMTAVFAAGLGVGVMAGALDLSLPGTAALAGVVAAVMLRAGLPVASAIVAGLALGIVVGVVNGLVTGWGFNPLIVTIGTLSLLTGLASIVSGGYNISGLSQLGFMGTAAYGGVPGPVIVAAILYLLLWLYLTKTRGGIRLMAVGGNGEAVRRVGLRAGSYRVIGFVVSGFCAALGGLITAAYVSQASPAADVSVVFDALTAVALAGVALQGGRGSLPRVLLGAIVIVTIDDGLTIAGVQPYWATAVTGLLLIAAISVDKLLTRNISRLLVAQVDPSQQAELAAPPRPVKPVIASPASIPAGRPVAGSSVPVLQLNDVSVYYGYARALHGVDLSVSAGEVVALLGDNGAGKSTLLKVVSGVQKPTTGQLRIHGERRVLHSPKDAAQAGVQTVYQDLALVEAQDVATNLNLGREPLHRFPLGWLGVVNERALRRESKAELDALGVSLPSLTRPVEMLSGGQRQVVAIARAAVRVTGARNGLLLLDEPTAALGHEQTLLVEDLVASMARRGIAVVIVTHDLPLAMSASDRVVVLNRGRKVADVPTANTSMAEVVAWITGAKGEPDSEPDQAPGQRHEQHRRADQDDVDSD